jgi:hypothetical protein
VGTIEAQDFIDLATREVAGMVGDVVYDLCEEFDVRSQFLIVEVGGVPLSTHHLNLGVLSTFSFGQAARQRLRLLKQIPLARCASSPGHS